MPLHPILKNAQAVIFDKDGTLLDNSVTWVEATKEFGLRAAGGDEALAKDLLRDQAFDWESGKFLSGDGIGGNTIEKTAEKMALWLEAKGLSAEHLPSAVRWNKEHKVKAHPLSGVLTLIKELKAHGIKLGLATNDAEKNAHAHLFDLAIHASFDVILGSDSGYGSKPCASMILGCCERLEVPQKNTVMVGDTDRDTLAGQAAGCQAVVAVLNGGQATPLLEQTSDLILAKTQDLLA